MERIKHSHQGRVCFRMWSRKSFAIFNSLGKQIRIGVLCLAYSILVLPGHAQQNRDTLQNRETLTQQQLDEVVVSAQLSPVVQSQLMRVVQVITRAEIEQSPARDMASLLSTVRGVDIRKRGTFGMQADISIRGGTFDQTLILLNGVNITDPQTGHHNLNLPVDLQSIERIEVLQGAGARIFGPNAFNGAVNIITREPGKNTAAISLAGGDHGFGQLSAATGFKTGSMGHFISLGGLTSDGFTENTDFRSGNVFYHGRTPIGSSHLNLQGGYNNKAFGANSFYSPRFPNQFGETSTTFASLQWTPKRINISPAIYWRRHHDRFELFRNNAPEWYTTHNYHRSDVAGLTAKWSHTSRAGKTSLGLDYRFEHIFSNVLGNPLEENIPVRGYDNVYYTRQYQRSGLGIMAEHNIYRGPFSLSAGLLTYLNTDLDNGISFFPGLDAGWQTSATTRIFASINRTLRLPTFTDLFYSDPDNIGNPLLKPEEAISLETGLKWNNRFFKSELAIFHRNGVNMIDWIKEPGDTQWKSMNLTRVNISGFESGVTIPIGASQTSHTLNLQTLSINYSYITSGSSSGNFVSNYALDHFRHKLDFSLNHKITANAGAAWRATWLERAGGFMLYQDGAFQNVQDFAPYWMVDARVFYQLRWVQIWVEASNLLNTKHVSIANVPQPGRWVRAGLDFKLPNRGGI